MDGVQETIQRSAQRMTRLIDGLTDFGTIQAGRLSIERKNAENVRVECHFECHRAGKIGKRW